MRLHHWNYTGNYLERGCWGLTIRTMNMNGESWQVVPWLRHFSYVHVEAHAPCHLQKCREEKHGGTEMQRWGCRDGAEVQRCGGAEEVRKCRDEEMMQRCRNNLNMWRYEDACSSLLGHEELRSSQMWVGLCWGLRTTRP